MDADLTCCFAQQQVWLVIPPPPPPSLAEEPESPRGRGGQSDTKQYENVAVWIHQSSGDGVGGGARPRKCE